MEALYPRVAFRMLVSASVLMACVIFPWVSPAVDAQGKATTCELAITTPSPGDKVDSQGKVQGRAKIPARSYLWVLAHVKYLREDWWPQGRRAAAIDENGTWEIMAFYGGPQDIGEDFEIALAVVNEPVNTQLRQRAQRGEQTTKYPPIEFPNTIDGCPPVKITVSKSGHR